MPDYTENLNLEKPLENEQYNIAVFNANADKIDNFAGQIPARSLTADKLTTGAKINGVTFKGDSDITLPIVDVDGETIIKDSNGIISAVINEDIANTDLSNLTETGNSRLHALKGYLDESELLTDVEGLTDIKSYAHSTFDLSKFTVVGNPNITDDGVVSGFKNAITNAITTPFITWGNSIKLLLKIDSGALTNDGDIITRLSNNDYCIILNLHSNGKFQYSLSSNGTSFDILSYGNGSHVINANSDVWVMMTYDGVTYKFYVSTDGEIFTEDKSVASSSQLHNCALSLGHTGGSESDTYNFGGSIDLKQFSIRVDGVEVFSGNKTGIDTIKPDDYTIIGNPAITDDGIASGFSTGNYITIPDLHLENADSWEIEGIVNVTSDGISSSTGTWLSPANGNSLMLPCAWNNVGADIQYQLYISSTENNWDIAEDQSITFPSGHTVKCNLKFTGTQYIYTCTDLDTDITKTVIIDNTSKIYKSPTQLGLKRNQDALQGSIDLNAFKIYVDGSLVYQACLRIPYTLSKTGSKIVNSQYRNRVQDVYNYQGYAPYYTLSDTDFTLPMGELYGTINKKADELYGIISTKANNDVYEMINQKANDNAVMHLTGNETINGEKTFTSVIRNVGDIATIHLFSENANADWTRTPSSDLYTNIITFFDKNIVVMSLLETYQLPDGHRGVLIAAKHPANNNFNSLRVGYSPSNIPYTEAPACDLVNSIVTTLGINKSSPGYVKLGNGIIIQWGIRSGMGVDSTLAITFPIAFTTTNYSFVETAVIPNVSDASRSSACILNGSVSVTGLTLAQDTDWDNGGYWIAIGY